jgi:hypothetical protein
MRTRSLLAAGALPGQRSGAGFPPPEGNLAPPFGITPSRPTCATSREGPEVRRNHEPARRQVMEEMHGSEHGPRDCTGVTIGVGLLDAAVGDVLGNLLGRAIHRR